MADVSLTKKEKRRVYLYRPVMMSAAGFVTLILLEVGWPNPVSLFGIMTGFFIGNFLAVKWKPEAVKNGPSKKPSKKQKVGRVVSYILLGTIFFVLLVRFFILI
ncbi:hypothetical protein [Alteribacter keqinensis]|uniref:Uncharacterized protein n=1 Tax=Alteribacter keqinensis TaxID=2483800 RepID=A0A3M7TN86_9BACI|nr:hypothetical protein [Alteribacter keqinensis]RNA67093.1 hypothetical protein EBO34_18060 [Alteribacter keqinensis]